MNAVLMQFSEEEVTNIILKNIFELTYKKVSSVDEELVDSGILTSITMVELAVALEKALSVSISFMEINKENFKSITTIKKLIQKITQYVF
ncbi:MAG TPA: phosphopantetheine-binding protein [Bacteroidia bacterium]